MDRAALIERLKEYATLLDEASKLGNPYSAERKALEDRLIRNEPALKMILNAALPGLGEYRRSMFTTWTPVRERVLQAIGILQDGEELSALLQPDSPTLNADELHPWVWQAAQTFWETQHHAQAVEQAWKSICAHLQAKASRPDVYDDDLINQCLGTKDPEPNKARLRMPGDRSTPTWSSRQRGLHSLGQACAAGIRNVVAHEVESSVSEQLALEYLATLSVLARWIDEAEVDRGKHQ